MKKTKVLSLLLSLALLLSSVLCFAACNGGKQPGNGQDGESPTFDGEVLRVSYSAAQNEETTFSPADKFTRGIDGATQDAVLKAVQARNKSVENELDITVEYEKTELQCGKVFADIKTKRLNASDKTRIDVYHNDIFGMTKAMLAGYLANVVTPPVGQTSYFDFTDECWNYEYMEEASFDHDKLYMLAGDYHLDMIRYAYVLFVNIDLFNSAYSKAASYRNYTSYAELTDQITGSGEWYYDDLIYLSREGHIDSKNAGVTDRDDARIAIAINPLAQRIFLYSSGLSCIEWSGGAHGQGTPSFIGTSSITPFTALSAKFTDFFNTQGVYYDETPLNTVTDFMENTIIMSMALLGEMESPDMRNTDFARGILPFPAYTENVPIRTIVHDQAEITAILGNVRSFAMASAYMQKLCEASSAIHTSYYEDHLGFKYNSDVDNAKYVRDMIDLVWDNIDTPFESVLVNYFWDTTGKRVYVMMYEDAKSKTTNLRGNMEEYLPVWQAELEKVMDNYKTVMN